MTLGKTGALAAALLCTTALAGQAQVFNRVASFPVPRNLPAGMDPMTESSAEIITATGDGMTLVYSDSPLGAIGLIDISDPRNPVARGAVMVDGEPTSVIALGERVFAGVNTSESYVAPSGYLAIIDTATAAPVLTKSCELGGQPDSIDVAPDGSFLAVAIENERDEDLNDGVIPQMPAGYVAIIPLNAGVPDCAAMVKADVTGLAAVAGDDPEPEFIDINAAGEIAVTLQENNHVAVLDRTGRVLSHFSAGAVTLEGVDLRRDGAIRPVQTQEGRLREPDAVKWLGTDRLATANEGDYEGGSRGFTIWSKTGDVLWESGAAMEHAVMRAGHYPDNRSHAKGVEPEGMEVGTFGADRLIFVLAERASVVGVYRDTGAAPEFLQLLPSGVSPEGAVAIPSRNLFATANEVDLGEDGLARSHVMIYERQDGPALYPTIVSGDDAAGRPIGWGALSGLVADPDAPGRLFAVNDSFYGMQPTIFRIDATQTPALIEAAIPVTRFGQPAQKLDIEGITTDGQGGFWLASEGRTDRLIPHALYHVRGNGEIRAEVAFPPELLANEIRFGAEGVTRVGDVLWIAMQREWKDDPAGMVKLLAYDTKAKTWGAVHYPLEPKGEGWMGLSEITAFGDHVYIVERDNQIGEKAAVKRVYRVAVADMQAAPIGGALPVVKKELVRDLIPHLEQWNGYVVDKVEGFAIDSTGTAWAVTDNDGVDDSSGETFFWSLGKDLGPQVGRLTVDAIVKPVYVYRGTVMADEHFDFDSAALRASDIDQLDLFAAYLARAQSPRVLIKGYTDSIGAPGYNLDLSLKRAEAVRDYVAAKAGRVSARMMPVGMGAADPVKQCPDMTGDALKACLSPNRRVTVTFAAYEKLEHPLIEQIAEVGPGQSIDLLAVEGVDLDAVKLGE